MQFFNPYEFDFVWLALVLTLNHELRFIIIDFQMCYRFIVAALYFGAFFYKIKLNHQL